MARIQSRLAPLAATLLFAAPGCGGLDDQAPAYASIKNDFNNPEMPKKPQWTICRSSYLGVDFGKIDLDAQSPELAVQAGLDNVLMIAAWEDPTCAVEKMLPIASKNEEEILPGQHRTIYINMPNHQGPCPPEGVAPIPQVLYDRMLALWPDLGFLPYDQRTQNPECL
jgi:hypothetical protein